MEILASQEGIALMSVTVAPEGTPSGLPEGTPFVCLLWNHASELYPDWTANLARNLVRNGCEYFVCAGAKAEAMHDCIAEALSSLKDEGRAVRSTSWAPGSSPVMTTWHVDEELEDVVFFFLTGTQDSEWDAGHFVLMHLGEGPERQLIDATALRIFSEEGDSEKEEDEEPVDEDASKEEVEKKG